MKMVAGITHGTGNYDIRKNVVHGQNVFYKWIRKCSWYVKHPLPPANLVR